MVATAMGDLGLSIPEVAERLDRTGFVCLENVISADWLKGARENVKSRLAEYGEHDFCIVRASNETDTPAHGLVSDPEVRAIFENLALARCPRGVGENDEVYSVLRVLAGPEREAASFKFHYDAAVVTMLVPVFIPTEGGGRSGDLILFPNRRPFRRSVSLNIFEKVLTQNGLYRRRILQEFNRAPQKYSIQLKPGNAYLFWGYRTFHGNGPCAPNTLRATLLLHYGNPHGGNSVLAAVKFMRRMFDQSRVRWLTVQSRRTIPVTVNEPEISVDE
jgi:hypothetical protein